MDNVHFANPNKLGPITTNGRSMLDLFIVALLSLYIVEALHTWRVALQAQPPFNKTTG